MVVVDPVAVAVAAEAVEDPAVVTVGGTEAAIVEVAEAATEAVIVEVTVAAMAVAIVAATEATKSRSDNGLKIRAPS